MKKKNKLKLILHNHGLKLDHFPLRDLLNEDDAFKRVKLRLMGVIRMLTKKILIENKTTVNMHAIARYVYVYMLELYRCSDVEAGHTVARATLSIALAAECFFFLLCV